jgi:PAS domain S-box-containing protein
VEALSSGKTDFQKTEGDYRRVDRNSLFLLLLLTVPAGVMAVVLYLWPNTVWIAPIPYSAVGILGSFVALFLAVFLFARYRTQSRILYISAGLLAMGIIDGFHAFSTPGSREFVFLHSAAGILGGTFFVLYALTETTSLHIPSVKVTVRGIVKLLGGTSVVALLCSILPMILSDSLPTVVQDGQLTAVAWTLNAVPAALFLIGGVSLFRQYRKTGANELFILTAILIFLFQACEVFYFATLWGVIWWFWQAMRLVVYMVVLAYVLKEYIQTSESLSVEIEERMKVEQALRKAEEDWRNSFNSLEEVMLIIDRDYNIEQVNSSGLELLRRTRRAITGRKCYRVIRHMDKPCRFCPIRHTLESNTVESLERYDDIYKRHYQMKSAPIFDENGDITKVVYSMSDITERINAEAKEKVLQRELSLTSRLASIGEVAAGITHEINNPLTGVIAFAQMLMQMDVPKNMREAVEVIHDGANRVVGIVDKLLTFARRDRPEKEYADINTILTNTLSMRSYEMRINNINVSYDLDEDLPKTMANIGKLQQVFLNIIVNAEQAMGRIHNGGEFSVRTERIDDKIRISLADDGPGIPEDIIDKLFDPFFTTKIDDGGTGLGLSISYGIVKEHEGRIYVRSVPGKGATFVVDLPIVAAVQRLEQATSSDRESSIVTSAKILVVDDEPHICRALDRLLTHEGHKVETAGNARTALRKMSKKQYDLVLLDIRMPGMSGIELYQRMKEVVPALQQRVICVTGDVISAKNKAFLEESGVPCVAKPFGVDELMSLVKQVLGGEIEDAQITYSHSGR